MTDQFSIENMKEELARALNKADEGAKTIATKERDYQVIYKLNQGLEQKLEAKGKALKELLDKQPATPNLRSWQETADVYLQFKKDLKELLTNDEPNIDFPLLLQDEAE